MSDARDRRGPDVAKAKPYRWSGQLANENDDDFKERAWFEFFKAALTGAVLSTRSADDTVFHAVKIASLAVEEIVNDE